MKFYTVPILLSIPLAFAQGQKNKQPVEQLDALVVESTALDSKLSDVTQSAVVLEGDRLEKIKAGTIAETLADQPGINQSHFGPSANRPIIRGLDKNRVRMLKNGTDVFDVSAQSEDHAVPADALLVDRIEVLRGSSALLYGGSAVGGAVNVIDRSIPTRLYEDSPEGSVRTGYNSANDGWNYGAVGYAGTDSLSFQINGFKRDFEDYEVPSFTLPDGSKATKVVNSKGESSSYGLGGTHLWDGGYAGISFSTYENTYGVPGEHADSETRIELESDRFEARSELEIHDSAWLTGIEFNLGYGDYRHDEIGKHDGEDEFETHATYLREGLEARAVFKHEVGKLRGGLGFHGLFDELKVQGEENGTIYSGVSGENRAITAEDSTRLAIFLVEEYDINDELTLNGGIRWESLQREFQGGLPDRYDSIFSASGGLSRDLGEGWNLSGNLSYTERAPDTAELYSDGPHHATEAFEVGNPNLKDETAVSLEVMLRKTMGKVTGQLSAYHTEFDHYVFLEGHGVQLVGDENMSKREYTGVKAEFQGLEAEVNWLALENQGWSLLLSAYGDMVRGENKSESTHLPRIPASRIGFGYEVQTEKLTFGMNLTRVFKQNKIPVHEEDDDHGDDEHGHEPTPTDAYTTLDAYASYDLTFGDTDGEFFIRGNNLTDELAKSHTSFVKDYAPLAGASVEVGLGFDF